MNTDAIFIYWTCFSSSIQLFVWKLLLKQILFSIKRHSYRPVFICNATSKFVKYINSIKKIIQVWWLCIWKVISSSVLCIIYKPVIIKCVVKKMVCFMKSLCFCFVVPLFSCQCTGVGVILSETPLKNGNFFAWKYAWKWIKKRNFHTIIKLCYYSKMLNKHNSLLIYFRTKIKQNIQYQ